MATLGFSMCKYEGGHPDLAFEASGILRVDEDELRFQYGGFTLNKVLNIPFEEIVSAEVKTEEQISKDVTLTRLLAFGIFAFGLKKKRVTKQSYLVVNFVRSGIEGAAIFSGDKLAQLQSNLTKARIDYNASHPSKQTTKQDSIPDQIKKLSDLKEAGVLTDREFEEKKKQLLARM